MSVTIERLNENARMLLALHFLALPTGDRYLRFATPVTQQAIARYVDGIDFVRDAVFAVRAAAIGDAWRGALAGVVHAAFPDDFAELGLSVLPAYRGRGLASRLAARAAAHARSRGVRRFTMQLLGGNAPMIRIAQQLGMTIFGRGTHLFARLELPVCSEAQRGKTESALRRLGPRRNSILAENHEQHA